MGDFENLFTWEPEARQVRDAELRAVQDRVNALQSELLEAQRDPTAMDEAVEEALREEDAKAAAALPAPEAGEPDAPAPGLPARPGDGIDVVAMSTGNMVDAVGPGLTREGVERMKAAARREHRIATVRASWIQERTTAIAETIQQMTPFYQEQAAAALAATEEVRDHVAKLVKGIATLDLYVGDGVRVHTIREGGHAPRSEPLTFVQRKLVMAEELAVWTDVDEWFDFDDTELFHRALRENDGLVRQVFPTERCVLVMATTRESVDYKADAYTSAVRNVENKKVFLLVRDGMNVHRVDSPVESHMGTGRLFPTRAEVDAPFRGWDGSKVRFEDVAFTEILRPLVQMVASAVSSSDRPIEFEVRGEAGTLPAEVATPMAVVLTELLQNTADHAFPADAAEAAEGYRVVVELSSSPEEFVIRVIDNGVGVPPEFSVEKATGLGLSIVRALVTSDLRGTIDLFEPPDGSPGTVVELRIPTDAPA